MTGDRRAMILPIASVVADIAINQAGLGHVIHNDVLAEQMTIALAATADLHRFTKPHQGERERNRRLRRMKKEI